MTQPPTFTGEMRVPADQLDKLRRTMRERIPIRMQFPNGRIGRALITDIRPAGNGEIALSLSGLDAAAPWIDPAAN